MRAAVALAFAAVGVAGFVVGARLTGGAPTGAGTGLATGLVPVTVSDAAAWTLLAGTGLLVVAAAIVVRRSRRALRAAALRDPVSGLYTAVYVDQVLPALMARDDRGGRSALALVRIAIDGADEVRRRHGRAALDLMSAAVGRHIASQTRDTDLPLAPDPHGFAVYLNCQDPDQAAAFCRRLSALLRSEQLEWRGDVIKVEARMGVAVRSLGEPRRDLERRALDLLAQADADPSRRIVG